MTYEDIRKANESIKTTDIKGKEYAEVPQRVKAFRMLYPLGFIRTEMISNEGEPGKRVCVFRACVGVGEITLGTGTAYESEASSFINKTSYIENCETSAVGRALGFAGLGIDTSIASYEEVQNAIQNQSAGKGPQTPEGSKAGNNTRTAVKTPAPAPAAPARASVTIDKPQITILRTAMQQIGQTEEKMLKHYGKEKIEDLTGEEYADALDKIKACKDRRKK